MIFICHSRKDEDQVSKLFSALQKDKFYLWYSGLPSYGYRLNEESMIDAILQSNVFIALLSRAFNEDYQISMKAKEIRKAIEKFKIDSSFKLVFVQLEKNSGAESLGTNELFPLGDFVNRVRVIDFSTSNLKNVAELNQFPPYNVLVDILKQWREGPPGL